MFLSLQHFVTRVNLNVPTMSVCPVSSGVMGRQTAVTAQMNGTVVSFCCVVPQSAVWVMVVITGDLIQNTVVDRCSLYKRREDWGEVGKAYEEMDKREHKSSM